MPRFLRFRETDKLPAVQADTVTVFVDEEGSLKQRAGDGTVSGVGGNGGYLPGSDRLTVTVTALPLAAGGGPILWDFGTPFVFQVGTAITPSGSDIVFVTAGLYAVQVHLPSGVTDAVDGAKNHQASLTLTCGSQNADGDDQWVPAIADNAQVAHAGALSANYLWTQAAAATLQTNISFPAGGNAGVVGSAVCQIVKLSNVAAD